MNEKTWIWIFFDGFPHEKQMSASRKKNPPIVGVLCSADGILYIHNKIVILYCQSKLRQMEKENIGCLGYTYCNSLDQSIAHLLAIDQGHKEYAQYTV